MGVVQMQARTDTNVTTYSVGGVSSLWNQLVDCSMFAFGCIQTLDAAAQRPPTYLELLRRGWFSSCEAMEMLYEYIQNPDRKTVDICHVPNLVIQGDNDGNAHCIF